MCGSGQWRHLRQHLLPINLQCKKSPLAMVDSPMQNFLFVAPLQSHNSHLLHCPLTQAEISQDTELRRLAATVTSAKNAQLVLVHWLKAYLNEARAGQTVPDMQQVLPLMIDILEQSVVSFEPAIRECLDVALHSRADFSRRHFLITPNLSARRWCRHPCCQAWCPMRRPQCPNK